MTPQHIRVTAGCSGAEPPHVRGISAGSDAAHRQTTTIGLAGHLASLGGHPHRCVVPELHARLRSEQHHHLRSTHGVVVGGQINPHPETAYVLGLRSGLLSVLEKPLPRFGSGQIGGEIEFCEDLLQRSCGLITP